MHDGVAQVTGARPGCSRTRKHEPARPVDRKVGRHSAATETAARPGSYAKSR